MKFFVNKKGPKIKEFHITPIAVVDPPLLNAAGLHAPYALRTVVELVTEDNISGISEIPETLRLIKL
jgi:glucarate dehydratase